MKVDASKAAKWSHYCLASVNASCPIKSPRNRRWYGLLIVKTRHEPDHFAPVKMPISGKDHLVAAELGVAGSHHERGAAGRRPVRSRHADRAGGGARGNGGDNRSGCGGGDGGAYPLEPHGVLARD